MPRYFIEVAYKGTNYSGFQIQQNANSIQAEVEKALNIFFKFPSPSGEGLGGVTGSSRTDAGVHALQNFFHFDVDQPLRKENKIKDESTSEVLSFGEDLGEVFKGEVYNLNALLPKDIVIKKIFSVKDNIHCRYDAISREYKYFIYQQKDPFLQDRAYYYPYNLNIEKLNEAAELITKYEDFTSFSKKNTQVNHFICNIKKSEWLLQENCIVYNVIANRFLRGMVKGLVGTMLNAATNKISIDQFKEIVESKNESNVNFSPPSHGLFLIAVNYKTDIFIE